MDVENVLNMNAGEGETSYANNSIHQRQAITKVRAIMEDAVKNAVSMTAFPTCIQVADLGCSSGPNTFLVISEIVDTVHGIYQQTNNKSPELQVFLNDLPGNDFNTVFKSLPAFYKKLKEEKGDFGPCFVSGLAGSFYGRLFPSQSLHFVHSSSSLHWLSQVPNGLSNNKANVSIAKSSPPSVFKAYKEQFRRDFSKFLRSRAVEIMPGGHMLHTFLARSALDPTTNDCCKIAELLSKSLLDLVAQGIVKEGDVDSFNLPLYRPFKGEVKEIIEDEGSFNIDKLETFELDWDNSDTSEDDQYCASGQNVAKWIRAGTEPMLATHFGAGTAMDSLFARFAQHVAEHLCIEKTADFYIVLSMTKK